MATFVGVSLEGCPPVQSTGQAKPQDYGSALDGVLFQRVKREEALIHRTAPPNVYTLTGLE